MNETCDVYEYPRQTYIMVSIVLFRFGADPMPRDGGSSPVVAILDKLLESPGRRYLYQLVSCLNILLSCITLIDMPYRVKNFLLYNFHNLFTKILSFIAVRVYSSQIDFYQKVRSSI